jgi:hypothetical protein
LSSLHYSKEGESEEIYETRGEERKERRCMGFRAAGLPEGIVVACLFITWCFLLLFRTGVIVML